MFLMFFGIYKLFMSFISFKGIVKFIFIFVTGILLLATYMILAFIISIYNEKASDKFFSNLKFIFSVYILSCLIAFLIYWVYSILNKKDGYIMLIIILFLLGSYVLSLIKIIKNKINKRYLK